MGPNKPANKSQYKYVLFQDVLIAMKMIPVMNVNKVKSQTNRKMPVLNVEISVIPVMNQMFVLNTKLVIILIKKPISQEVIALFAKSTVVISVQLMAIANNVKKD